MKTTHRLFAIIFLATVVFSCTNKKSKDFNLNYPQALKVDTIDNYFGSKVKVPYRWMENMDSDSVEAWVKAENKLFDNYMEHIGRKASIRKELKELWNYTKYSQPFKAGDYYFFFKNKGLQDQSVLYKMDSLDAAPEVFLDPNKFSKDGTVALTSTSPSNNGKYLAYGISKSGSDWREIFVKNIKTGKKLDDHLKWIKFSGISWADSGFYYSRYNKPDEDKMQGKNKFHKVYYHKIGTPQSRDRLVYHSQEHPLRNFYAQTTEDEKYLVLNVSEGASGNNALYIKDLQSPEKDFQKIITKFALQLWRIQHFTDTRIQHPTPVFPKKRWSFCHAQPERWRRIWRKMA